MKGAILFRYTAFLLLFLRNSVSYANVIPEETGKSSVMEDEARPPTETLLLDAVKARDHARAEALLIKDAEEWRYETSNVASDCPSNFHVPTMTWSNELGPKYSAANKTDANGSPIIHYAADFGDARMVELLLDYWANANATDRIKQTTALHLAVQRGYYDIAELLIESDNIMLQDGDGKTPLQIAIDRLNFRLAKMMILHNRQMHSEVEEFLGWTNLHRAAFHGDMEMLRRLKWSEINIDLNKRDILGLTALHYAAMRGHEDIVNILVEKLHIDINARDVEGRTPLHHAAEKGHQSVALVLVDNFADINIKDKNGATAIFLAGLNENIGMATWLEEMQSQIDEIDKQSLFGWLRSRHPAREMR